MSPSVDYNKMIAEQREEFIRSRTQQEAMVNSWYQKISGISSDLLAGVIPTGTITLQTLCPELYVDKPDREVYIKQLAEANAMFDRVNALGEENNRESVECLLRFKEISSTTA